MALTLTLWQKKASGYPTRAGDIRVDEPSLAAFERAVPHLLSQVEPNAQRFQIVAQVGDSSRGFQLDQGRTDEEIAAELWTGYQSLVGVNG